MKFTRLWALALMALSTGIASAQAETLQDYTQRLAEHPQVTTILEQSTRLRELSHAEMSLPDPQLILGIDNMPLEDPAFDRFLPTAKVLGFKQQIPSYELRQALSAKQETLSNRQQLLARYTKQRLEAILIAQLVELAKVNKLEKLAKLQLGYYQSLEDDLKGQLEAGNPVYGRFSEIDVERSDLEQRLNDLKVERTAVEEELISLVREVPKITIPSRPKITWQREEERLYPVLIAKEYTRATWSEVDAAEAAFNPDYGVQAVYKQRESGSNFRGDDWFSVQATISIPLWYESSQEPRLRAAEANQRSAEFALEDTKRAWIKQMSILKAERDIAAENTELLEKKKAALREMARAANRNYEAGNAPLETVLDAQIDELTIASQLASMRSRHTRLSLEFNSHIIGVDDETN